MAEMEKVIKSFVTTQEAAQMLGVTIRTVQMWTESGLLSGWKTEGGHRRIHRDSVQRLLHDTGAKNLLRRKTDVAGASPAVRPLRVLIVEDDQTLLRLYRLQLARWSLAPEVMTASNGFEALVRIGKMQPDLLISDLSMPEMDGFQMLRTLRSLPELDTTEIVVVTGLDKSDVATRGGLPDGIEILSKPIPFPLLVKIAQRVAAQNGCRIGGRD